MATCVEQDRRFITVSRLLKLTSCQGIQQPVSFLPLSASGGQLAVARAALQLYTYVGEAACCGHQLLQPGDRSR